MAERTLLFSVNGRDPKQCRWDYFTASGKGGQNRNRRKTAARVTHLPSGAVGQASDSRSKEDNRRSAFRRMGETKEFKLWHKMEVGRLTGEHARIEQRVAEATAPRNLRIEVQQDGKWAVEEDQAPVG